MPKKDIKQPKTIYHYYGYFAIEFEQMVLTMKRCIYTIFKNQGLKEITYLRILLHDQTAFPIQSKLRSLIAIYYENEPDKIKILEKLFVNTSKIIEKRNELIHGSFFVHMEPEGDLYKDKIIKSGIKIHTEKIDLKKLNSYIKKIEMARDIFEFINIDIHNQQHTFRKFINEKNIESINID